MDERKDILRETQKSNPLVRFFDKQTIRTNPFGGNQSADRAYRRAERLVAALYLVTNHIQQGEPIKISVRTGALLMLENFLALRNEMRTDSQNVIASRASIRHQISLVRTLSVAGFLSIQNANIMIEGLDDLGAFLNASQNSPLSDTFPLSQESLTDIREGHAKDTHMIKDRDIVKDMNVMSDIASLKKGLHVREDGIIAVLRSGGELGIRDIAANLPEYSEKMIQRHLVDLIEAGRVQKTGLKRWSRYSVGR